MLVTLVAVLCNSQLCLEKVVTTSDQSGITMSACAVNAQIGIADWLAKGPYREWRLARYKCVLGKYVTKNEARAGNREAAADLRRWVGVDTQLCHTSRMRGIRYAAAYRFNH